MSLVSRTKDQDTYSETYRHECECRWAAKLPTVKAFLEYVADVRQERGDAAADKLKKDSSVLRNTKR
jgi:hypothetical protein